MPPRYTLCFPILGDHILLGLKKRGWGEGRWNGFGGKVEPGESVEAAVARELLEENGLSLVSADHRGLLSFHIADLAKDLDVEVFAVTSWNGEPTETEEMRPQWYGTDAIPYPEMWPDDIHWLPLFLAGKQFRGEFWFRDPMTLERYELTLQRRSILRGLNATAPSPPPSQGGG